MFNKNKKFSVEENEKIGAFLIMGEFFDEEVCLVNNSIKQTVVVINYNRHTHSSTIGINRTTAKRLATIIVGVLNIMNR